MCRVIPAALFSLVFLAGPVAAQETSDLQSRWTYRPELSPPPLTLGLGHELKFGKWEVQPSLSSREDFDNKSKLVRRYSTQARVSYPLTAGWRFEVKGATTLNFSRESRPAFKNRPAIVYDLSDGMGVDVYQGNHSTIMVGVKKHF